MTTHPPIPPGRNEPIFSYLPGSLERRQLVDALDELSFDHGAFPMVINGQAVLGAGDPLPVKAPHRHSLTLGQAREATKTDVTAAIDAALAAAPAWAAMAWEDRAAIFLKAADLLAGPWRQKMNAATMLGQSKTVHQAEIDSACELIDMWRWNVAFADGLYREQPISPDGSWNRIDLRPLEGFVLAITPFNFTSIAGNLPTAPAIMGNTVVWKPARTQLFSATIIMNILQEAGLPPGVINMITGGGAVVTEVALPHPSLAGIHFTGSTDTFNHLWKTVAHHLDTYHSYPRIVGETGGKDFVLAHSSANVHALQTALIRGAFEYQGQKCSAASRAYVPRSLWDAMKSNIIEETIQLTIGDPQHFTTFLGAVIDEPSFNRLTTTMIDVTGDPAVSLTVGGTWDDSVGWYVYPTIYEVSEPHHRLMEEEFFGPILTVYVYEDDAWEETLRLVDTTSPYALTGAIFATDRAAIAEASAVLRQAAGNFYVNDKPTGAVIGQQPFGGARKSGTNDKAGSPWNLLRWTSPRTIKELFVPPTDWRYPHMNGS